MSERQFTRVFYRVDPNTRTVRILVCDLCGVLIHNASAHYTHAHPEETRDE